MLEPGQTANAGGKREVLNAFRHLICWNDNGISREESAYECSTPFGILYVGTPGASISASISIQVLNAFRHLICWNTITFARPFSTLTCSTPFGILYVGTVPQRPLQKPKTRAQRLSASYMLEHCAPSRLTMIFSMCSTPFGILYVGTPIDRSRWRRVRIVLNAFRHLICWNQRDGL